MKNEELFGRHKLICIKDQISIAAAFFLSVFSPISTSFYFHLHFQL